MNLFCGGKFSDRVSSEKLLAVSAAGPPAFFFQKLTFLDFWTCPFLEKVCFVQIWSDLVYLSLERPVPLLIKQGGGSGGR